MPVKSGAKSPTLANRTTFLFLQFDSFWFNLTSHDRDRAAMAISLSGRIGALKKKIRDYFSQCERSRSFFLKYKPAKRLPVEMLCLN